MQQGSWDEGEGGGTRRELILDTRGTCFLCLEATQMKTSEVSNGLKDVCLRNICRYLKIDQSEVLLTALNLNLQREKNYDEIAFSQDDIKGNNWDFTVLLCSECASLTKELSKFIRQMEIMKLLMGQHLQTLQQILTFNEQKQEKILEKLMKAGGEGNSAEARLITQLRGETVEKCSAEVLHYEMTRIPRVRLERIDTPVVLKDKRKRVTFQDTPPSPTNLPNEKNLCFAGDSDSEPIMGVDVIGSEFVRELVSKYSRRTKQPGRYRCTLCETVKTYFNIGPHLTSHHPEKFFMDYKLPHVTETTLKHLCITVLFLETEMCHDAQEKSASELNSNRTFPCVHCGYKFCNDFHMRYHLVLNHYKILQEKLIKSQKETKFPICHTLTWEQLKRHENKRKNKFVCTDDKNGNGCGKTFTEKHKLKRHRNENCSMMNKQRFVWRCKDGMKSRGCGQKFSSKSSLNRHKSKTCPMRNQRPVWKCYADMNGGGCGCTFTSGRYLNSHKKQSCPMRKQTNVWKCLAHNGSSGGCGLKLQRVA